MHMCRLKRGTMGTELISEDFMPEQIRKMGNV